MPRRRFVVLTMLAFITTQTPTPAAASTTVSGPITTNTAWDLPGSPYVVTADVIVRNDAVLTIAPGVRVQFNAGTTLWIGTTSLGKGTLVADANVGPAIVFTSNAAVPAAGDWSYLNFFNAVGAQYNGDAYLSGSVLRNCVIEYASNGVWLGDFVVLSTSSGVALAQRAATSEPHAAVENCTFRHNSLALYIGDAASTARIRYCQFIDNNHPSQPFGIVTVADEADISFCTFTQNNGVVIYGHSGLACRIRGCTFTNNTSFALYPGGGTLLEFSEIRDNTCGGCIVLRGDILHTTDVNIVNNTGYSVTNESPVNCSLPNVWWGTTSLAEIADMIYDCEDNPTKGCVFVDPILLQAVGVEGDPVPLISAGRAWPNPFSTTARVEFALPRPGHATLRIYDLAGREMRTLVDEQLNSGPHSFVWDGFDAGGRQAPSGPYLYRLAFEGRQATHGTLMRLR